MAVEERPFYPREILIEKQKYIRSILTCNHLCGHSFACCRCFMFFDCTRDIQHVSWHWQEGMICYTPYNGVTAVLVANKI